MAVDTRTESAREAVPFRVVDADGNATELTYSSPRPAAEHDEFAVLEELPWFEAGRPLHNWQLHDTDFYDEVDQIWGRRWGAEGIGKLREVLVSRPTENETRPEIRQGVANHYSHSVGQRRPRTSAGAVRRVLPAAARQRPMRMNYVEPPVPAIGTRGYLRIWSRSPAARLVVRGGAIIHRMGLGSWQRGREVIWCKALAALGVPTYLTIHGRGIGEPGAGQ